MKRFIILAVVILIVISLTFAYADEKEADKADASSMRLMQTEGNVTLTDQSGNKLAIRNRMRLYSGCGINTEEESRAGILLDDSKVVTVAENSAAVINQSGKKLEVAVNRGKMYFDVSKPLESDECFEIRTSTMVLGIRGTSGCVEAVTDSETLVTLITGHAEITCFAGDVIPIEAGQQVRILKKEEGSCDDSYLNLSDEQSTEMLQNLDWIKQEQHGSIWEKWQEYYSDSNILVPNNRTPKKEKTDPEPAAPAPTDYPNPFGW